MKGLIFVCLLATLCDAQFLVYYAGDEIEHAQKILRSSQGQLRQIIMNVEELKEEMWTRAEKDIKKIYRDDILNIEAIQDDRLSYIFAKAEEAKEDGKINAKICLSQIAMEVRAVVTQASNDVLNCTHTAQRQWKEAVKLYERVIEAGGQILNEDKIMDDCHDPESWAVARCMINRIMVVVPEYKQNLISANEQVENMKLTILSNHKACDAEFARKVNNAVKNTNTLVEECITGKGYQVGL